jgi:hypothetical protein
MALPFVPTSAAVSSTVLSLFQPPYRRFAPIGSAPLYKKQLGVFLQIFNILRSKGGINFKIDGIG